MHQELGHGLRLHRRDYECRTDLDVLPNGTEGAAVAAADDETLSSDQHTLSRRNASEARRRPVWSSTIASSMRPRWKHACPRTKYL